jgi:hypothetical protein
MEQRQWHYTVGNLAVHSLSDWEWKVIRRESVSRYREEVTLKRKNGTWLFGWLSGGNTVLSAGAALVVP